MAGPDLTVFDRIKTKADFDREEEMFQLKRIAIQQAKSGNLPAALQIADRLTHLRTSQDPTAQQQIEDVMMAQKMMRVDPGIFMQDGAAQEIPGYTGALSGIKGGVARSEQDQKNQSDLNYAGDIGFQGNLGKGRGDNQSSIEAAKDREREGNEKVLPVIDELKSFNEQSPSIPYAGKTQVFRRLYPGTSEAEASVDLMRQARIDLAAPLAKQLGVNPTDKDFQASLDRIFDIEASKESRSAQIDALQNRIMRRQRQLSGQNEIPAVDGSIFDQPYAPSSPNPGPPPSLYERSEAEFNAKKGKKQRLKYNPVSGEFE
jgi:hypothetical protein